MAKNDVVVLVNGDDAAGDDLKPIGGWGSKMPSFLEWVDYVERNYSAEDLARMAPDVRKLKKKLDRFFEG